MPIAFLSGLSMVAATVLSGRFLKWNTSGCNAPSGPWSEPSQSPSSSFETAGLAAGSATLASPVRLNSIGSGPPRWPVIVPANFPSGPSVRSQIDIINSTAMNFTLLPLTARSRSEFDRQRTAPLAGDRAGQFPVRAERQIADRHHQLHRHELHALAADREILDDQACRVFGGHAHTGDPLRFLVLRQVEREPDLAIVHF